MSTDGRTDGRTQDYSLLRLTSGDKNCSKVSVIHALEGPYQVSLAQQIRFYSKTFDNKRCRYNEGIL